MTVSGKANPPCSIDFALDVIGGKWKIRILYQLYIAHVRRYGELKKSLSGITHKVLSQQLKELERDGLLQRKEFYQIPPKVEYSLTKKGESVLPILKLINEWGEANRENNQENE